jgi:hypothetical protein
MMRHPRVEVKPMSVLLELSLGRLESKVRSVTTAIGDLPA